jgi:hypothetical protein
VEDFVYGLLTDVFGAQETAPLAIQEILDAGSYEVGPKSGRIEDTAEWKEEKNREKGKKLHKEEGTVGDFDD